MEETFKLYEEKVKKETKIKDSITNDLEPLHDIIKNCDIKLQRIHFSTEKKIKELYGEILEMISPCKLIFKKIMETIPKGEYHRYHYLLSSKLISLISFLSLSFWLNTKELIKMDEIEKILEIEIPVEEYLNGTMNIFFELSRFSVNLVIQGDYETPKEIDSFLKEFYQGLKQMNFKNDGLRKKFDSSKYEIKKVEQVIYDLSLRK
jgi:predicted translin family RNA/ssDNA-binding protein